MTQKQSRILIIIFILLEVAQILGFTLFNVASNSEIRNLKNENKKLEESNAQRIEKVSKLKRLNATRKSENEMLKSVLDSMKTEYNIVIKSVNKEESKLLNVKNTNYSVITDSTVIRKLSAVRFNP